MIDCIILLAIICDVERCSVKLTDSLKEIIVLYNKLLSGSRTEVNIKSKSKYIDLYKYNLYI